MGRTRGTIRAQSPEHNSEAEMQDVQSPEHDIDMDEESEPTLPQVRAQPKRKKPELANEYLVIPWRNDAHKDRFDRIKGRTLISSRFVCIESCQILGILENVKTLFTRIGMWKFVSTPVPTFKDLTFEFFGSVKFGDKCSKMEFFLNGEPRSLTLHQLNKVMEFPIGKNMKCESNWPDDLTQEQFYFSLVGDDLRGPRANQIQHPVFRYIQRVLAGTIFGRGETSAKFKTNEMYLIYCMLNNHKGRCQPNVGYFLMRHLKDVVGNYMETGAIGFGGIVTKLAMHFKINLNGRPKPDDIITTDLRCLIQYRILKRDNTGNHFVNIGYDGTHTQMPLEEEFKLDDPRTWYLSDTPPNAPRRIIQADQGQSSGTTSNEPSNAMILEQLQQMNTNFATLNSNYSVLINQYRNLNENYSILSSQYDDLNANYHRVNSTVANLYGWAHDADMRMHDMWHHTHRLHAKQLGVEQSDIPPYPASRWFPQPPSHSGGTTHDPSFPRNPPLD